MFRGSIGNMLFSAEGRIGRREYWTWLIIVNLLTVGLQHYMFGRWSPAPAFLSALFYDDPWRPDTTTILYGVLLTLSLWPIVCLNAKRWHDRGKSGWIAGVVMALGIACYALRWMRPDVYYDWGFDDFGYDYGFSYGSDFEMLSRALPTLYIIFLVWTVIECGLMPGTLGANRYGSDMDVVVVRTEYETI